LAASIWAKNCFVIRARTGLGLAIEIGEADPGVHLAAWSLAIGEEPDLQGIIDSSW